MPIVVSKEAIEFAEQLGRTTWADIYNINCGLHSGIPKCCILYYISSWHADFRPRYFDTMRTVLQPASAYYIICPRCMLEKNIIETKKCNCGKLKSMTIGGITFNFNRDALNYRTPAINIADAS